MKEFGTIDQKGFDFKSKERRREICYPELISPALNKGVWMVIAALCSRTGLPVWVSVDHSTSTETAL